MIGSIGPESYADRGTFMNKVLMFKGNESGLRGMGGGATHR